MNVRSLLKIVGLGSRSRQSESDHVSNEAGWWAKRLGGGSPTGITVDAATAKTSSTYWACSTSISADVAKLPLNLYQRGEDNARTKAVNHPAYKLLLRKPNPEMSAMVFREKLQGWALDWGNGMAEIERANDGSPIALWPMKPWRTQIRRRNDARKTLYYEYRNPNGQARELDPEDVFHIRGPTFDGIVGINVVTMAEVSLGGVLAADRFTAAFYGNHAMPAAILKHPGKFKDKKAIDYIRESWEKLFKGADNAGKIGILEEGMEVQLLTMPLDNAQFLEQRQFGVSEVCRWFRFPPHKAGDLSRATFSNIEHQGLEYVVDCLGAWLVRWEQEAAAKLLREDQQETLYYEHLTDALLRGDFKSRTEGYQKALDSGHMNLDEVRAKENLPPLPNGEGKIHRVPLNMQTVKKLIEDKPKPEPKPPTIVKSDPPLLPPGKDEKKSTRAIVEAFVPAFDQAARNLLRIEAEKLRRAAARSKVLEHADDFYKTHAEVVRSHVFPAVEALGTTLKLHPDHGWRTFDAAGFVRKLADRHCEISARQALRGISDPEAVAKTWTGDEATTRAELFAKEIADELDRQTATSGKDAA
jgi:HK97 family phage portal protein